MFRVACGIPVVVWSRVEQPCKEDSPHTSIKVSASNERERTCSNVTGDNSHYQNINFCIHDVPAGLRLFY